MKKCLQLTLITLSMSIFFSTPVTNTMFSRKIFSTPSAQKAAQYVGTGIGTAGIGYGAYRGTQAWKEQQDEPYMGLKAANALDKAKNPIIAGIAAASILPEMIKNILPTNPVKDLIQSQRQILSIQRGLIRGIAAYLALETAQLMSYWWLKKEVNEKLAPKEQVDKEMQRLRLKF